MLSRGSVALLVLATMGALGCGFLFPVAQGELGFTMLKELRRAIKYHGPTWTADGHVIIFESRHRIEVSLEGNTYREWRDNLFAVQVFGPELSIWESDDAPDDRDGGEHIDATHDLSHDGKRIALATLRHGYDGNSSEIATANLDGSDYRRLTESEGVDLSPSWSPDGSLIAFASNREQYLSPDDKIYSNHYGIYVMEASGENVRRLAPTVYVLPRPPVWSPDGKWLAFMGDWDRNLYTVSVDGGSVNNLGEAFPYIRKLGNSNFDKYPPVPAWSPDSRWLAYVIWDGYRSELIVISNPEGTETKEVLRVHTPRRPQMQRLSFSPDGSLLRFTAHQSLDIPHYHGGSFLYEIGIDGSNRRKIANLESDARIAWSPDDSRIAVFLGHRRPNVAEAMVYTISADGTDKRVLIWRGHTAPVVFVPEVEDPQ